MNLVATPAHLSTVSSTFEQDFSQRLHWSMEQDAAIEERVAAILADVQQRGDAAVLEYTARFDGLNAPDLAALELTQAELQAAFDSLPEGQKTALTEAAARVRSYHEAQKQSHRPKLELPRCGRHPAGPKSHPAGPRGHLRARRQSRLPQQRAHERHPRPGGRSGRNHHGRAHPQRRKKPAGAGRCLHRWRDTRLHHWRSPGRGRAGLRHRHRAQGGQITGPGNAYVASAKKRVFGHVGIDMIAGPSEILVLADGTTPAEWVAMDLFSQAEHDELAQSILLCPDADYIAAVQRAIDRLLPEMPRAAIIAKSLSDRGALIHTRSMEEACAISNRIAPEHLEVSSRDPHRWEPLLKHAGAIFLGGLHQREPGRLLRRPQPRPAHQRHGAFQLPAGRVRLPKTQQPHRSERARGPNPGPHRQRAGPRRGPARARAGGRNALEGLRTCSRSPHGCAGGLGGLRVAILHAELFVVFSSPPPPPSPPPYITTSSI